MSLDNLNFFVFEVTLDNLNLVQLVFILLLISNANCTYDCEIQMTSSRGGTIFLVKSIYD